MAVTDPLHHFHHFVFVAAFIFINADWKFYCSTKQFETLASSCVSSHFLLDVLYIIVHFMVVNYLSSTDSYPISRLL